MQSLRARHPAYYGARAPFCFILRMRLIPYLHFNGDCAEALAFYEKALGGKLAFKTTFGEAPQGGMDVPASWAGKIMHSTFIVEGQELYACDPPPAMYKKPQGYSVAIDLDDPAKAERFFKALSDGATVKMPLQKTFWAERFGMLEDRYGIPWMVNCEQPK